MGALTTLANAKQYLAVPTSNSDANITRLIRVESSAIEAFLGRTLSGLVTRTAVRFDGNGSDVMMLPDTPIIAIQALSIDGTDIAESPDGMQSGYMLDTDDDCTISLIGYVFCSGRRNVVVSWTAGYETSETDAIPAGNAPTLSPVTGGLPVQVNTVIEQSTGIVFTAVVAANVPAVGQYAFTDGVFTFASADAGRIVTMDYYYVPGSVEQACIEMIGMALKTRDNLGVKSKNLAGESISYSDGSMSLSVQGMLQPYRKVVPL